LPLILIAVACFLAFIAIFAIWANRQLLNTDNWTDTSSELLENDEIRTQVADFLVAEVYANVDVKAEIEQGLQGVLKPRGAQALAGPAAGALQTAAQKAADELLSRPRAQELWENANRTAHEAFLDVVEGDGDVVSTTGGDVTLDLKSLLAEAQNRLGVGGRVAKKLPADAGQIEILRSDQLELAQDLVRVLKALAIGLVLASLALIALAIYLARGWRREALRATGVGLIFVGAATLLLRSLAGDAVVNSLATTESVRPAAEAAWSIGTSLLEQIAAATVIYGVVVAFAAWLAGPTGWAVGLRRAIAPYLREPGFAWAGFGVLVLALLAWAPTPAFRRVAPALLLIALLALGVETLRRQTAREFPDAQRGDYARRAGDWIRSRGRQAEPSAKDPASVTGSGARLEQLDQLGRLRESGVLDAEEFEREKRRILGAPAPGTS
jgi:hypothetical protein